MQEQENSLLDLINDENGQKDLEESADLYAEIYKQAEELQALTDHAILDWPECGSK